MLGMVLSLVTAMFILFYKFSQLTSEGREVRRGGRKSFRFFSPPPHARPAATQTINWRTMSL